MRPNPSLTARLRIGFAVLFALLLAVSLLGVGRLFQIRVDYEDTTSRLFQLELESERMRSAFILEQTAVLGAPRVNEPQLTEATGEFQASSERAAGLTGGDTALAGQLQRWVTREGAWGQAVAEPALRGERPPEKAEQKLTTAVTSAGQRLTAGAQEARESARSEARDDTRATTLMVAAGLGGALIAALLLFSGLINSMRAPLGRLVDGARRLAGGELDTRVEVGGPIEIATLGSAFNDMATALERDASERDRIERMKDDFVLTVSHELRTPVTVVKGFAEMLTAQKKALNSRQAEAAEVISESAGQLQRMINDLLDLARSDAGKLRITPKRTSVKALAQRMGRQMRPHFEESGQRLTVSVEKGLPDVMADPDRIGQVLANLLTNANKYTPEGARVRMTASMNGGDVEFAVADNGPGLEGEELEHVFDRFWRAQSGETQSVGGTGLGLAIAKSLVELHGGRISAQSKPGEGATFRFVLPIVKDDKQAPKKVTQKKSSAGARSKAGARTRSKTGAGTRSS
jgi:signal transduction histidine kinase